MRRRNISSFPWTLVLLVFLGGTKGLSLKAQAQNAPAMDSKPSISLQTPVAPGNSDFLVHFRRPQFDEAKISEDLMEIRISGRAPPETKIQVLDMTALPKGSQDTVSFDGPKNNEPLLVGPGGDFSLSVEIPMGAAYIPMEFSLGAASKVYALSLGVSDSSSYFRFDTGPSSPYFEEKRTRAWVGFGLGLQGFIENSDALEYSQRPQSYDLSFGFQRKIFEGWIGRLDASLAFFALDSSNELDVADGGSGHTALSTHLFKEFEENKINFLSRWISHWRPYYGLQHHSLPGLRRSSEDDESEVSGKNYSFLSPAVGIDAVLRRTRKWSFEGSLGLAAPLLNSSEVSMHLPFVQSSLTANYMLKRRYYVSIRLKFDYLSYKIETEDAFAGNTDSGTVTIPSVGMDVRFFYKF